MTICDRCGAVQDESPGDHFHGERLTWSLSIRCPGCPTRMEVDGDGPIPAPYRERVLSTYPAMTLCVPDAGQFKVLLAKTLRACLQLDHALALRLAGNASTLLSTGTASEIAWLQDKLASSGISALATEAPRTDACAETDLVVRYWPES
jgi:hypothetical protein